MSQKEVVIIGAGVIGCSIAYHLAQQGVPSQIIERDSIAARASGKSWAVFTYPPRFLGLEGEPQELLFSMPVGSVKPWLDLFWLGYYRLPDIALDLQERGGIDIGYGELPWIKVALSENDEKHLKESLSFQKSQGYYEGYWIEENDLRNIYPDINPLARGGVVLPYLQVEPYRYTLGLAQAAEKMGVNIRQGEVVGFQRQGSRVTSVTLATGTEVEADVFVLAMGPWSGQGTSRLGKEIPILINREQCLRMQVPKQLPPYALATPDAQTIIPKVNGEVILGHAGLADLQTSFDVSLTTEEAKMTLVNDAIELLPTLSEAELVEHRGDFECWSPPPNRIQPVIGRLPEWDNTYIATRFGTVGMMLSLGAGQVMADLIIADGRIPERSKNMMEVLSPARLF
jgi:glycine/D-amino acid oxidase-like deaminating enzyme